MQYVKLEPSLSRPDRWTIIYIFDEGDWAITRKKTPAQTKKVDRTKDIEQIEKRFCTT